MENYDGLSIELTGAKKALFAITIFLVDLCVMGELGVMPVTYNIYETFGDGFVANYIVSGAELCMAIGAVVSTMLMAKISKRRILLAATFIFAISSIFCVSVMNGFYICVMRSLMGFSEGVLNAVAVAYIAQLYIDEGKRAGFIGFFNAAGLILSAVLSYASGALSVPDWTHAFYAYFPMALIVICVALFIPELGMERGESWKATESTGKKEPLGFLFKSFMLSYVLGVISYATVAYFISVYIAEMGIGDSAFAGIAVSVSTLGAVLGSIFFGQIYSRLGKNTATFSLACAVIAMLLLYFVHTAEIVLVGCFFDGIMFGTIFSYSYAYLAEIVPPSRIDDVMGYSTATYGLTLFITPFIISAFMGFAGTVLPVYIIAAVLSAIGMFNELATNGKYKEFLQQRDSNPIE